MTTYKELAEHLEAYFKNAHRMDEVIAILRSLDAQEPVLTVCKQPDYWHGGHFHEGTRSYIDPLAVYSLPIGTKLDAAPVAAVRKAMARLADLLDEDKFMEIEGIFTSAGFTPPVAAQASKPLSDAEIESGVPMHRKGSIAFRDGVRWAEQRHGIKERG